MKTTRAILWFVVLLMVSSGSLMVISSSAPATPLWLCTDLVSVFVAWGAIAMFAIVHHLAKLESELAKYLENPADLEAAKRLAEFLRKSA
jgi:hypothetical protein